MSNINIEISNNVVVVTIDNKYCGTSAIPYEYNNKPESEFVNLIANCITRAIEDAKEKMWPRFLDEFYYPDTSSDFMYGSGIWHGHIQEEKMKERGLVFRTKEEAIETSKKMLEAIK